MTIAAYLESLNLTLFRLMAAPADVAPWHIALAKVLAVDLIYLLPLALVWIWLRGTLQHRSSALRTLLAALLALGGNQLLALLWQHPRPFMLGLSPNWLQHAADSSFPSDHMTVCSAIACAWLLAGWQRLGLAAALLAVVVAWARIYLGVHFPLDMLGALLMALAANGLAALLWRRLGARLLWLAVMCYRRLFRGPIQRGWCLP
ncbi:phosphatase PAP2 family protein [Vogesella oryzae]|uniref:phosphatase PAP2 family protein n=1 Tax=Vogesella oryzae TaxID=1735285 RepID=UPI001582AAD7|nr:phosphatase PAP2 family protein [Vogesella oryzae]